jgi:hypothetical protein
MKLRRPADRQSVFHYLCPSLYVIGVNQRYNFLGNLLRVILSFILKN